MGNSRKSGDHLQALQSRLPGQIRARKRTPIFRRRCHGKDVMENVWQLSREGGASLGVLSFTDHGHDKSLWRAQLKKPSTAGKPASKPTSQPVSQPTKDLKTYRHEQTVTNRVCSFMLSFFVCSVSYLPPPIHL